MGRLAPMVSIQIPTHTSGAFLRPSRTRDDIGKQTAKQRSRLTQTMFPINWTSAPSKNPEYLPVQIDAAHSAPWHKPMLSNKKPDLKPIQTLAECVRFLTDMAKETEDISKARKRSTEVKDKNALGKSTKPDGVDHSKSLILSWAKELNSLSLSKGVTKRGTVREEVAHKVKNNEEPDSSKDSEMIMKWARELQGVSKSLGVTDDDLKQILNNHSMEQLKLVGLLPFLEFVVWSLLSQQSEEDISKIWLSAKQRQWRTVSKKYIPNSVWQWIQSASADVHLDSSSCPPWLCVSEDKREMCERHRPQYQQDKHQQFDELSCILGLSGFSNGRHYWEVLVPINGCWRLGVTSASAPRKGKFQITPAKGYWTIYNGPKNLWACTDPYTKLQVSQQPQVVGVYVDYKEGQVSFYNAQSRLHIYTFTQIFREALFPVFMCRDGNAMLKIHTPQMSVFAEN
uniref:B30.2/SPRY domain-containing protein n=2 Tax=Pygocentrus nattereri TaxID=42514 RepID=A0A3B4D9Q8_PYGNA